MPNRSITNIHIFGDSLTDEGGENGEFYKFRKIPAWLTAILLGYSPWGLFSNGPATWADFVALEFEYQQKLKDSPLLNSFEYSDKGRLYSQLNDVQCWAQGGATAYNYNSICSYFKFPRTFYARPFVTHLNAEAKKAYANAGKRSNSFKDSLVLNMIGLNDLFTIGYMDEAGAARAIRSIKAWMDFYALNGGRDVYLANMPNITLTPSYHDKTDEEKEQAWAIINSFNCQLNKLVASYQRHKNANFEPYDTPIVLQEDIGKKMPKEKAFIIQGKDLNRKIYFWQGEKYLENNDGTYLVVDMQLSKKQWKRLEDLGQASSAETDNLKDYIKRRAISKAKLNCHVKLLDLHTLYQYIHVDPEENGFTIGCALYTTSANDLGKVLEDIKTKSRNAVILQEITNGEANRDTLHHYKVYYIKEGQIVKSEEKLLELKENSDSYSTMQAIYKKRSNPASQDAVLITGCRELRDPSIGRIISSALNKVMVDGSPLHLADVSISLSEARKNSGLPKAKKDQIEPAGGCLFWDDVHPTQEVHARIAGNFIKEIERNYRFKERELFLDDMNSRLMPVKSLHYQPCLYREAPDDLTAWREPTKKIITKPYEIVPKKAVKILGISSAADFKEQLEPILSLLINFHNKIEQQVNKLQRTSNNSQITKEKLNAFNKLRTTLATHGEEIITHGVIPEFYQKIAHWHHEHQQTLNKHRNSVTRFFSKKVRHMKTNSTTLVETTLEKLSHGSAQLTDHSSLPLSI
jgi:phospholipase/lecithinase/hemolysin